MGASYFLPDRYLSSDIVRPILTSSIPCRMASRSCESDCISSVSFMLSYSFFDIVSVSAILIQYMSNHIYKPFHQSEGGGKW